MHVELVRATTPDGLRLDGALAVPQTSGGSEAERQGVLCLHGAGGNFYGSTMFEALAERLAADGFYVLRANTRGHDLVSTAVWATGASRQGAAFETVADCRHDIAGWTHFLRQRGIERVILLGHSLGAIKAVYAAALEAPENLTAVVAMSPPRLCYRLFKESEAAGQFLPALSEAQARVADGRGDELMRIKFPTALLISAASYVDKYGPEENYDVVKFAGRLPCPAMFTFGEQEVEHNIAFGGLPELIAQQGTSGQRLDVQTIPGADHFYSAQREQLTKLVSSWLSDTQDL